MRRKRNPLNHANVPLEHDEQAALFNWADLHAPKHPDLVWLYAVPNGARTSMSVARKLKREGLKKGYPDVGLDVARGGYHGLRIEMKRQKGGRLSPEQKVWIGRLTGEGYHCSVAAGWQEAVVIIRNYLQMEKAA